MRFIKIHRIIKFTESPYLEPYINNNTNKRNIYKGDEVKKNFYKLMNNAPYGKTIENAARRSDIRLLNDPEKARRVAEKPHCVDFRIFDEDLIGIEIRKCNHFINKPFQHGFSVLKWSEYKMYTFYAKLKDVFGDKVRMLYTDTDSFFLQFFVEDLATELNREPTMRDWFDFGEIRSIILVDWEQPPTLMQEWSVISKMRVKVIPYMNFIALRPKSYSVHTVTACKYDPDNEMPPKYKYKAVAKGITRENIKNLKHEDYQRMMYEDR
jgi:hypothetical protein